MRRVDMESNADNDKNNSDVVDKTKSSSYYMSKG